MAGEFHLLKRFDGHFLLVVDLKWMLCDFFCLFLKYRLLFLNINYSKLYTDEAEWFEWLAKILHSSLPYLYSTVKLLY